MAQSPETQERRGCGRGPLGWIARKLTGTLDFNFPTGNIYYEEDQPRISDDSATQRWKAGLAKPGTAFSSRNFKDEAARRDEMLTEPVVYLDPTQPVIPFND